MRVLSHGYILLLLPLLLLHHVHGQDLDNIKLRNGIVFHGFTPKEIGIATFDIYHINFEVRRITGV